MYISRPIQRLLYTVPTVSGVGPVTGEREEDAYNPPHSSGRTVGSRRSPWFIYRPLAAILDLAEGIEDAA